MGNHISEERKEMDNQIEIRIENKEKDSFRTFDDAGTIFRNNPIEMLRFIRHASAGDVGEIKPNIYREITKNAVLLETMSRESIRDEFNAMLTSPHPVTAMELLRKTTLMHYIIPELEETYEMTQNHYHFGTVWEHSMKVVDTINSTDLSLRMSALLHDIGKISTREVTEDGKVHFIGHQYKSAKMAETILRRLEYSKNFIRQVSFLVHHHMETKAWKDDLSGMKSKHLRKLQFTCGEKERFLQLMMLIDADNKSHAKDHCLPNQVGHILDRSSAMEDEGTALFNYQPPFSAKEVMRIKGVETNSAVKECLQYLQKLAYVKPIRTRERWIKLLLGYKTENNE